MNPGERFDLPEQRPKPGDFVFVPSDGGMLLGRVVDVRCNEVHVRLVNGWNDYTQISNTRPAPLEDVWRALEVEQSRIDRRLADLQELKTRAFEAALKAGR